MYGLRFELEQGLALGWETKLGSGRSRCGHSRASSHLATDTTDSLRGGWLLGDGDERGMVRREGDCACVNYLHSYMACACVQGDDRGLLERFTDTNLNTVTQRQRP